MKNKDKKKKFKLIKLKTLFVIFVVALTICLLTVFSLINFFQKTNKIREEAYRIPESIIPRPQNIEMISFLPIEIDSNWKIVANLNDENENFTAYYLKNKTLENSSGVVNLDIININEMPIDKRIVIGNPNKDSIINQIASSRGIDINSELQKGFNQGYVLLIQPEEILILANSTTGTFYGMISLTWLLKTQENKIVLPNTKIIDWPDLEIRGFYGGGNFLWDGELINTNTDREKWIEILTKYKYNLWTGSLRYLSNKSKQSEINKQIEMKDFLLKRHFYPSAGISPLVLRYYNNNLYQGVQAQNASLIFNSSDGAVPNEEEFVLNNSDFEDDSDGDGVPDYWNYTHQKADDYWSMDYTESHSGSCSAKLTLLRDLTGTIESSAYLKTYNYELSPNKIYFLTFWAKKKETVNNGHNPQVTVVLKDNQGNISAQSRLIKSRSWTKIYMPFSTYNEQKKMYIYSRAQGTNPLELWVDDFEIIELNNKLLNIIETDDTQLEIWNKDKTIKYTKDIDYSLTTTGDFNFRNPLEGKKTYIKRIPSGDIPPEAEIIADYDFVINFQQTRNEYITFSDPLIYQAYADYMLNATMENLNPDFVFLSLDEIRGFNRDSRAKKRGLENYQVLSNFINNIVDMIHSYNPDTKILICDDMINPFHNGEDENCQIRYGGQPGKTWYALDLLQRDNVILVSWWYSSKDYLQKMRMSPQLYNELGFKFIAGSWDTPQNIRWWSYLSYQYNAFGMIDHEFDDKIGGVPIAANYSWNAIKTYTEECSPDYIEICDGIDNDCDNIYWINSWQREVWHSNTDEGFNLSDDSFNCGSCGNICYYPKGYGSCVEGICQFEGCYEGYYNADGDLGNGCECSVSNNGIEICDGIDNDCDGEIDEGVCFIRPQLVGLQP